MAKFYNRGPAIFQEPEGGRMGFRVATCDNGCGDEEADTYNASEIVRCLNQDDELKLMELKLMATWLLKQKTLHISKQRRELLERILK